ncbi:hypothetical protein [Mesorhizobium sp. W016]
MLGSADRARSSRHTLVIVGIEEKRDGTALAAGEPEVMNLGVVGAIGFQVFSDVSGLAANPPLA